MEFDRSTVPEPASTESFWHEEWSLRCALLLPSFLGGGGEILIICQKPSPETPQTSVQPWGHSTAATNLYQVGTLLIASVKNTYFFLTFSYHQFENHFYI